MTASPVPYRVLARKYRPTDFDGLIGQDALVRTLSNAIETGRLAHAFILTGVRGVGKTTTARIIARALNCIGPDGQGGPTVRPCGACEHCRAIAEDRHVDVVEMDAASNNSVDNIREIVDAARYRPVSARYKVYILDEVHMLSNAAFNALLKTLEEPPEHVKFVFATTEIRRVPVTVLSRCQRFDLRRVETEVLLGHFRQVAEAEGVAIEPEALAMIVRAADGSVRDGLSLLDQAIAHAGNGTVGAGQVREMLGLADRVLVFDLLEAVMRGDPKAALALFADMYAAGADPVVVVQDLLALVHWLSRLKADPAGADDPAVPEAERTRGRALADGLGMAVLTRAWQMLLKGIQEAQHAPSPRLAVDMLLIRLAHVADWPTPGEIVARLENSGGSAQPASTGAAPPAAARPTAPASAARASERGGPALAAKAVPVAETVPAAPPGSEPHALESFDVLLELLERRRMEPVLVSHLRRSVHLVAFAPGRIEFRPTEDAPSSLAGDLRAVLERVTGRSWAVSVSNQTGEATRAEQQRLDREEKRRAASEHPLVRAALEAFPGARITAVRDIPLETVPADADAGIGEPPPHLTDPEDDGLPFDPNGDMFDLDDEETDL